MKLPSIFSGDILTDRGDKVVAKITNTDRKVLQIHKKNGALKFSATEYPNGTVVKTFVEKIK